MKTLGDFPDYTRIHNTVQGLRGEKAEISARLAQIEFELSQPKQVQLDGQEAWSSALEGTVRSRLAADNRSELRDERIELEGRLLFVTEALDVGEQELDKVRGRASSEICATVRPQWIAQIKIILESLKKISAANEALDVLRSELEREDIVTGSLPFSGFDLGGIWSDPYGGKIVGYQRYIAENFPELSTAAGMAIKSKLAALAKREEEFERREQLDESL